MKIKCAAILYNGVIYEGDSHAHIGLQMLANKVCPRPYPGGKAQGFITEDGKFVSRQDARKIAIYEGQVKEEKLCHPTDLFSEDLRLNLLNT